ncbi:MAG: SusC/RagA family protein, partial [Massilibacteroides sp.]|nr:SusC/RagA family protein [Massilibacteroides sp.]
LLNDRLNFTLDYYKKKTDKLLLNIATPYFLGGDNIYMNKGKVENNGFEFSVNAIALNAKDLFWEMQANFSTNKNKIVDLGGETIYGLSSSGNNDSVLSDESYILQEGLPLGELYGYKWLGIWQEKEAEEAAKFGNKPGDNKYADLKSDGTINASDRTNIGNGTPRYTWGFNSTIRYKKWDLNVLLQGVHGAEKLNVMYAMASSLYAKSRTITLREAWENSWTPENKSNKFPNVSSKTSTVYINSTQWLQDASFIRLRNLSLGYTFGKKMTKVGDFRVYLSAQNLFTITKYKGYDPEASSTLTSDVATGIDTGITPTARTYTVGVQLSF